MCQNDNYKINIRICANDISNKLRFNFSNTAATGLALLSNGYRPIPIKVKGKRPAIDDWSRYGSEPPSRAEIKEWAKDNPRCGWGLVGGNIVVIDIDEEDRQRNRELFDLTTEELGTTPAVRIGRRPRRVMVYRAEGEIAPRKIGNVEIRGQGWQTVVYGDHPKGGFYRWPVTELVDLPIEELPSVTPKQIDRLIRRLQRKFGIVKKKRVKRCSKRRDAPRRTQRYLSSSAAVVRLSDRSKVIWRIIKDLIESGWGAEEIVSAIDHSEWKKYSHAQLLRQIEKARGQ